MLYAQNGATDAEIQHDEKCKIARVSGQKVNPRWISDPDPARGTVHARSTSTSFHSITSFSFEFILMPEMLLEGGFVS